MLKVENLSVRYQELRALRGVSLEVDPGNLVALIGSNGAGKTTLLNTISGLVQASAGEITWDDTALLGMSPDSICRVGIIQVPEGRKLFPGMTVLENLEMGAYSRSARASANETFERVFQLFPILAQRRKQHAGSLSGGEQQMLALGRALMARPRMLMLDEPSLGLAPVMAAEIFAIVKDLNESGMTILLVSQEVLHTLSSARYGYLLENGKIHLSGPADRLLGDQRVKESYLGI